MAVPGLREEKPRVTIVGGGIVGLMAATSFQRKGCDVHVVDIGEMKRSCSFGNAGSLSPGSVAPLAMPGVLTQVPAWLINRHGPLYLPPGYAMRALPWLWGLLKASRASRTVEISHALHALLHDSVQRYDELLRSLGRTDLMRRTGQMQLYPTRLAFEKDRAIWQLRRNRGVSVDEITGPEIRELEPAVGPAYKHGVYLPNEGVILDPAALLDVLSEEIVRNSGIIEKAEVTGFQFAGGLVRALTTTSGPIAADTIVIAAGAWSNKLARQLGEDLPLETQRGYHVSVKDSVIALSRPVVAADRKVFVTPTSEGIRIAGTVEFGGLDAPPNFRRADRLARSVERLLPSLSASAGSRWMGHRPCLPDSLPVLDRARDYGNVYYAFGNGHLGLTAAPMMGQLVSELVCNEKTTIDIGPLTARRFA